MLGRWHQILLLFGVLFSTSICQEEKPLEFEDIVDKKTYDKMRPPKPEGRATMVSFHVTVMSLDTIDEGSMTYAADVFFAQEWKDHRLILPENMTREYRLLPVEWLHLIWRPDSFFKNAKKVTFQTMTIPNHYVWLYKDRTILYMVKLTLLLSCAMHFENYPHDEQICRLSMESLSHTTDDLVFEWLPEEKVPLAVDSGIELPQLELVSNDTGDCTSVYSTGNFTCLEVIFKFRRRLGYYLFHTYIPTCLIVMMSWISFWIKPEAVPARVTLGVTSLLTLSTQHANSQKSLPPVSYIKAIDIFMSSCTVFVFLSLIEYAFVNVMMGDISEVERKDKTSHLRNIIVTANTNLGYRDLAWQQQQQLKYHGNKHPSQHAMIPINEEHHHHHQMDLDHPALNTGGHPGQPAVHTPGDHYNPGHPGQPHTPGGDHYTPSGHPNQPHQQHAPGDHYNSGGGHPCKPVTLHTPVPGDHYAGHPDIPDMCCPKHGGKNEHEVGVGTKELSPDNTTSIPNNPGDVQSPSGGGGGGGQPQTTLTPNLNPAGNPATNGTGKGGTGSNNKKQDPKEIMKKRRERAICIDRVSRVLFPSTFILLNIIYWLIFSEILDAIMYSVGGDEDKGHK